MNMEMTIATQMEKVIINVTVAKRKIGDIVGFAELQFIDDQNNIFLIARGYTIRVKTFSNKPTFTVVAPAYKSGFQYKTSFIVENKSLWKDLSKNILEDFINQNGGLNPEDYTSGEININDINI